jgi:acetyl esterase/lipase
MPSSEFVALVDMLRASRKPNQSVEQQRENEKKIVAKLPPPPGLHIEADDAQGVPVEWTTPPELASDVVLFYLHGGGYCTGSIETHRGLVGRLAISGGMKALSVGYRLAPEHPFPAAVDDAVQAYRWLRKKLGDAERIVVAGDSAGGGLAIATAVVLRDSGDVPPAALVCLSPSTDLAKEGASFKNRAEIDPLVTPEGSSVLADHYLAGADPKTPLASPLYAEYAGLPPMLILVGTAEILHDDSIRVVDRAREAGIAVDLIIGEDMIHIWPFFAAVVPESREAIDRIGDYLRRKVG